MKNKRIFILLICYVVVTIFCFLKVDGEIEKMEGFDAVSVVEITPVENKMQSNQAPAFEEEEAKKTYIGRFELTAYCPCENCSGEYGHMTSTGKIAKEGRTVAVDPTVIPYGTEIVIGDKIYVAEDCGGAVKGKIIDIFFESHQEAKEFGRKKSNIFILKKEL